MTILQQAILDPQTFFKTPQEVLNNPNFSSKEKKVILRLWAYDAEQLERAKEENMQGEDETMLKEIMECLTLLESQKEIT